MAALLAATSVVPGRDRAPPPSDHRRPVYAHTPTPGHQRGNLRRHHRLGPPSMNPARPSLANRNQVTS